ncbi:uncharacterized protein [Drosophila tropicalis]|uniref:uncharacterized protein n=1 Tax=Drosophila tropicalis TaxID=46794 RepID=UPI0035ABCA39
MKKIMALSARHGFAGLLLYTILIMALVHPKMYISISVESYFFSPNYLATIHMNFTLNPHMILAALPLTALVVIAWSRWDSELGNPIAERLLIVGFLGVYVAIVLTNIIGNVIVIQKITSTFHQNQFMAWRIYIEMQISFLKAVIWSFLTRKPLHVEKLVYALQ